MAGVAKWCLGEPQEAIAIWRAGLDAKYARAAGLCVRMPLLLLFASILKPGFADRRFAEGLLLKLSKDVRINNWPAPIALLMLDRISEAQFEDHLRDSKPQETRERRWLAAFYKGLVDYEPQGPVEFKGLMRELSHTSRPEWQDEAVLLSRIWNEEFFLARHEAT